MLFIGQCLPSSVLNICHSRMYWQVLPLFCSAIVAILANAATITCCRVTPAYWLMLPLLIYHVPTSSAMRHISHVSYVARCLLSRLQPDTSASRLRGCDCLTFFFHFSILLLGIPPPIYRQALHCLFGLIGISICSAISVSFYYNLMLRHHG